jgi:hypothetical protein
LHRSGANTGERNRLDPDADNINSPSIMLGAAGRDRGLFANVTRRPRTGKRTRGVFLLGGDGIATEPGESYGFDNLAAVTNNLD